MCFIRTILLAASLFTIPVLPFKDANAQNPGNDYFAAATDKELANLVRSVEIHHNKLAYEHIRNGRYDYALNELKYTLRMFPNHPRALQLLTVVASVTKSKTLAVSYFEQAVTLYPQYALTQAQYGHYLATTGDLENGIQKLRHAVEMDSKLTAGYVWLARAYEEKGDFESAREAGARAKELGYSRVPPVGSKK